MMKARIIVKRGTADARRDQYRSGDGERCIGDHVLHWNEIFAILL